MLLRRACQSRFIQKKKNTFESPTVKLFSLKYDWMLYIEQRACDISVIYQPSTSDEETDTNRLGRDPTLRAIRLNCTKVQVMSRESGICLTDMSGSEGTKIRVQVSTACSATEFDKIMKEVRAYVRAKGIMLEDKFLEWDCLRKGYVTESDFANVCKEVFREILNDEQIKEVQTQYHHPEAPHHCNWSQFMHDAEPEANAEPASSESSKDRVQKKEVLKRVAQNLKQRVDIMNLLEKLSSLDASGTKIRVQVSTASSSTDFDKIMRDVRAYVRAKGIMLEDKFLECDCLRKGYVTESDFANVCKEVFREILNDEQIKEVQTQYYHPDIPHHCNWSQFMHDAEPEANAEPASSESSKDRVQKKEVLKRVAQSLKQRVDIMNLLEKLSSLDVSGNEVDDDEMVTQDKLFQLLGETTEKDDLRIVKEIYTDKMGFKYQEFETDLKVQPA
ncbi:PREDICTED: uncharacterized protein LOC107338047 [Acropora digitifera]|uniref:uncharacterized protein LOC107338047 n=1 Tax=Acropora digitifera TaxID=70779 RepID=UPI00077A43D6|nr:PREDICTED: uncharacterized protein LOC107338047 [Acropora digitifera]